MTDPVSFLQDYIEPCNDNGCDTNGCKCTYSIDIPYNKTIQMVFTNYNFVDSDDLEHHPIHMHGHNFAVLAMGYASFDSSTGRQGNANPDVKCSNILCSKAAWRDGKRPPLNLVDPPVRDSVIVPAGGYVVVRFLSNNPGFWVVHCHLEMHMVEGMVMVMREAVGHLPKLPRNFPTCNMFDWTSEEFEYYQKIPASTSSPATTSTPQSDQSLQTSKCFISLLLLLSVPWLVDV